MTVSTRNISGYAVVKSLGGVAARSVMGYAVSEPMWPAAIVEASDVTGYALVKTPTPIEVDIIGGYVLYEQPPQVEVDLVSGYTLYTPPMTLELGDVGGYILRKPAQPLPKNITGFDAVIKMIIATQPIAYDTTDFSLDPPRVWNSEFQNTVVSCNAEVGSYLYGSMDFYYQRRELSAILPVGVDRFALSILGKANTLDLLPELNELTGMLLTADDIVSTPLVPGQTSAMLLAKPTSWFFQPGTSMKVGDSSVIPLSSAFSSDTIVWS